MSIATVGCTCHGLEPAEDQGSADVGSVIRASKPDLMARGVAIDLLQVEKRVGPQYEAAEYEDLSREENLTLDRIVTDDRRSHRSYGDGRLEPSMKAPMRCQNQRTSGRGYRTMRLRRMVT